MACFTDFCNFDQHIIIRTIFMNEIITQRLAAVRQVMQREHLDAFIFPSTDPHNSEYVPARWKGREWISGFDGSAGTAVVTMDGAALWTDSRYFIAAEEQLQGTEFHLMRMRMPETPTIAEWLEQQIIRPNTTIPSSISTEIGIDGMCISLSDANELIADLHRHGGLTLRTNFDVLAEVWHDRPEVPADKMQLHPIDYAGETASDKLQRLGETLKGLNADRILISSLDDIAWLLNLRGNDVEFNPVAVCYLLAGMDGGQLFVDSRKLTPEVERYLSSIGIAVSDYDDLCVELQKTSSKVFGREYRILADPTEISFSLFSLLNRKDRNVVVETSPIPLMKSIKNPIEVEGFKKAMIRDGVALVRLLRWLEQEVSSEQLTELTVVDKLEEYKHWQPNYRGPSFGTIAAYESHGAIVHYEPTSVTNAPLHAKGLLLLDCGSQYPEGTTDVTRTIPLGPVSDEQRRIYTLVLKGHIQLELAVFPEGASGTQIDALAREPLWRAGLNYLHGTGHGVGSYLNVHEGPHQVRMEYKPAPLKAYMTITDEPGVYLEGLFGVRIENTLLTVPHQETPFGRFLAMQPLTLCPISMTPVIKEWLTDEEKTWLKVYHQKVRTALAPFLTDEEQLWLETYTEV